MIKIMMTAVALSSLISLSATAAPQKMTSVQLDQVVAGGTTDCVQGNNGWGNGADGSNPGTDSGATAASKIGEGGTGSGLNLSSPPDKINTNPVSGSTGR